MVVGYFAILVCRFSFYSFLNSFSISRLLPFIKFVLSLFRHGRLFGDLDEIPLPVRRKRSDLLEMGVINVSLLFVGSNSEAYIKVYNAF